MNKPTRPLALEINDATNEITAAVEQIAARHGLPCYLMEPLVSVVLSRLENGRRTEVANAEASYKAKLEEYERTVNADG